jgi:hypothetical protein
MIILCQGLQWTNRKIGKIFTLYHQELSKNWPSLGTFCTQSVTQRLISVTVNSSNIFVYLQQVTSNNTDSMLQPSSGAVMNSLVSETKVCNSIYVYVVTCMNIFDIFFILIILVQAATLLEKRSAYEKFAVKKRKFIYLFLNGFEVMQSMLAVFS